MLVRVKVACRVDRPRADGSPGFMDLAAGQALEILETDYDCFLYEPATVEGGMTEEDDKSPFKG